ncbi:hypothetical protein [Paracoccus sp. (in: a-proteobacteria)]|uniref:hypothetical protein n=1 Tax=Paracoccus sp. TaxID=267 RepID=UPI0026DF72D9|nr:hypothetical protein [Paracoccus sp. (in: a-proteobacteria)]MDO5648868.1 hypothetical protein [Paracoccus sp. (in: a-proteobacteria)]
MPRRLSFNARQAHDAVASAEVHVALFEISHDALPAPIRLSTDCTERLSSDPLIYGTRSRWRGANPVLEPYLWVVASAVLPSELDEIPAAALIVLDNLDSRMVALLRSITSPATFHMAVVLASSPDEIEAEYTDLMLMQADITASEITLHISREEIELEHFPSGRMSRDRFPGLHR